MHPGCWKDTRFRSAARLATVMALTAILSGCIAAEQPRNRTAVEQGQGYQAAQRAFGNENEEDSVQFAASLRADLDLERCQPNIKLDSIPLLPESMIEAPISRGDLLRVTILNDEHLSGDFEIEAEGMLRLPQMPPFRVHGVETPILEKEIRRALVTHQLYRNQGPPVSVKIIDRAPVRVHVRGAVFEPGLVEVNQKFLQDRDPLRQTASGDLSTNRVLSGALRSAAGVRPDADIDRVLLKRDGQTWRIAMGNAVRKRKFRDPFLMADDEVIVPSMGCFQPSLAKANIITRQGIKVQLSNLTVPALRNSASAIEEDARSLKYGTTLMQILFKMNCVGGVAATSADRHAIVISTNPITGESEVIRRRIEALIRRADRDDHNPILMPDDSIACYDSTVTNVRDVISSFKDLALPFSILGGL